MSKLRKAIDERFGADSPVHSTLKDVVPALLIRGPNDEWVFPWTRLIAAQYRADDNGEELVLCFEHYKVIFRGENLNMIVPDIAAFRLEVVGHSPEGAQFRAGHSEPIVTSVEVCPRSDLSKNKSETF